MWTQLKKFSLLCYHAGMSLNRNYGVEMAGYLAFLTLLSLFPYLLLMVSAAGLIGQGETGRNLIAIMLQHLPSDAVTTIQPRIVEITSGPPHSILTFSILGAIWTSSSTVETVRGMLNRIYHVRKPPAYISRRLTSIGQIIMLTLLILAAMLLFVFAPIALQSFSHFTGIAIPVKLDRFMTSYFLYIGAGALLGIVSLIYYVLPNIRQTWSGVLPGAAMVVVLWAATASLISFYLNDVSKVTLIYGSLSGFIATLIFFYVINLIFIYGAEFNHAVMMARGKHIIEREAPEGATVH